MTVPVITPLPPAPTRADAPSDFTAKADAFVAAQVGMVGEQNTQAEFTNQRAIDADASAQAAATSATAAAESAAAAGAVETDVAEQIARAETAANNAAASAAAAESAPGSMGNLALLHATAISF